MQDEYLLPSVGRSSFLTGISSGYFALPGAVSIPMPSGCIAKLQVRVWDNRSLTVDPWEQALADTTLARGVSAPFSVTPGGGLLPPAPLLGLESFNLHLPLHLDQQWQGGRWILSWPDGLGIRLQTTADLANPDWRDVEGSDAYSQITILFHEQHGFLRLIMGNSSARPVPAGVSWELQP